MSNSDIQKSLESSLNALKTIYYVIIGLAITEALKRTFLKDNLFPGIQFIIFKPERQIYILLLFALMPTICRFVHGATIHLGVTSERNFKPLIDFCGFIIQASFFYMMAITLDNPRWFLIFFILMLLFDTIWIKVLVKYNFIKFGSIEKQWFYSDLTLTILFIVIYSIHKYIPCILSAGLVFIAALIATILDYYMNREFYFPRK